MLCLVEASGVRHTVSEDCTKKALHLCKFCCYLSCFGIKCDYEIACIECIVVVVAANDVTSQLQNQLSHPGRPAGPGMPGQSDITPHKHRLTSRGLRWCFDLRNEQFVIVFV